MLFLCLIMQYNCRLYKYKEPFRIVSRKIVNLKDVFIRDSKTYQGIEVEYVSCIV